MSKQPDVLAEITDGTALSTDRQLTDILRARFTPSQPPADDTLDGWRQVAAPATTTVYDAEHQYPGGVLAMQKEKSVRNEAAGDEEPLFQALNSWGKAWGIPNLALHITVAYSPRMQSSAGTSHPATGRIHLNARFLSEHPDELLPTVCHEAAHVAVRLLHGADVRPHGPEWQTLMRQAGYEPTGLCLVVRNEAPPRPKVKRPVYLHRCPVCHYARRDRTRAPRWKCPVCEDSMLEVVAAYT